MRYGSAAAFRAALEQRLANTAEGTGTDLGRLRRRAVFERILARLAVAGDRRWILKGGVALEVRLGDRARATRDLDLATSDGDPDGQAVRDALIEALSADAGDHFGFRVGPARDIAADQAGRPGWRFAVTAEVAGRRFEAVRVEVVARTDELTATERVRVPSAFAFADLAPVEVEAVDRRQHFAEKLHALTRAYGDRPSTRVKDLPDLLLLIADGLDADPGLVALAEHLFDTRATHPLPESIPDPPASWEAQYREMARKLDLEPVELGEAHRRLSGFWRAALDAARAQRDGGGA